MTLLAAHDYVLQEKDRAEKAKAAADKAAKAKEKEKSDSKDGEAKDVGHKEKDAPKANGNA